jgi:predicted acyltransferase (DUF342 family)
MEFIYAHWALIVFITSILFVGVSIYIIFFAALKVLKKDDDTYNHSYAPYQPGDPRSEALKLRKEILNEKNTPSYIKGPFKSEANGRYTSALYCTEETKIKENCYLFSLACDGNCEIDPKVKIVNLLDANGDLTIKEEGKLGNKVTASGTLSLYPKCEFISLFGNPIITKSTLPPQKAVSLKKTDDYPELPITEKALYFDKHFCSIPPGSTIKNDIIAKGNLTICRGSTIEKGVKCYGDLTIEEDVTILGNVFGEQEITVDHGSKILGNLFSQGNITLSQNVTIGEKGKVKSVVCKEKLHLNRDVTIYGYALTYEKGTVHE